MVGLEPKWSVLQGVRAEKWVRVASAVALVSSQKRSRAAPGGKRPARVMGRAGRLAWVAGFNFRKLPKLPKSRGAGA